MLIERFLRCRRGVFVTPNERRALEGALLPPMRVRPRATLVKPEESVSACTLLLEGFLSRFIDDKRGMRQLVAVHVPGEFVDLHSFPLGTLDHGIGSLTSAVVAQIPHNELEKILVSYPKLERKLWFATLIDASLHRAWLFRVGRLDAVGRVAHFISELNVRLEVAGLSDGQRFSLGLTQADLAEACGMTSVHVNRVIRQLREMELCTFRSSTVEILNRKDLERVGHFNPHYLYIEQGSLALQDAYT